MSDEARIPLSITGAGEATRALQTVTAAFTRLEGIVLSLATGAFAVLLKRTLESTDAMGKAAQQAGVATEAFSTLAYAARQNELSFEEFTLSAKFLNVAIAKGSEALQKLGVDNRDASGNLRNFEDVLLDVADKFTQLPDGALRAQLALELFSRSGAKMIPFLTAGREGIQELREEARRLGLEISGETAAAADRVNDKIGKLQATFEGAAIQLTEKLIPAIEGIVDAFQRLASSPAFQQTLGSALTFLGELAANIANTFSTAGAEMGAFFALLSTGDVKAFVAEIGSIRQEWIRATQDIARAFGPRDPQAQASERSRAAVQPATDVSGITAGGDLNALSMALARGHEVLQKSYDENLISLEQYEESRQTLIERQAQVSVDQARQRLATEEDVAVREAGIRNAVLEAEERRYDALLALDRDVAAKRKEIRDRAYRDESEAEDGRVRDRIQALEAERNLMEGSFRVTAEEKRRRNIDYLTTELEILERQVEALEAKARLETDPDRRRDLLGRAGSARREAGSVRGRLAGARAEADPNSVSDQLEARIVSIYDRLNTLAQGIANIFESTIQSAIDGIAGSIEGLIRGTMNWADALRNVASSILNGVISAISRMFAEWIAKRLLAQAVNQTASVAEGATDAAAKAPGALMSSISSTGVAAVVGLAAFIAAIAAVSGAFARGGRPPRGRPALVGEEGPELFVPDEDGLILPAGVTERLVTAARNQNVTSRVGPYGGAGTGQRGRRTGGTVVLVTDLTQARDYARAAEGQAEIRRLARNEMMDLGFAL